MRDGSIDRPFEASMPDWLSTQRNRRRPGAADQERCVAARLAGHARPCSALPWFWSQQGETKLQIAGLVLPHDDVAVLGDPSFSVFCFRNGKLTAADSLNRPADHMTARKLLVSGTSLRPKQLSHPLFDSTRSRVISIVVALRDSDYELRRSIDQHPNGCSKGDFRTKAIKKQASRPIAIGQAGLSEVVVPLQ